MSATREAAISEAHERDTSDRVEPAGPERVCPNRESDLIERKCKLLCLDPACGYYISCSDFY